MATDWMQMYRNQQPGGGGMGAAVQPGGQQQWRPQQEQWSGPPKGDSPQYTREMRQGMPYAGGDRNYQGGGMMSGTQGGGGADMMYGTQGGGGGTMYGQGPGGNPQNPGNPWNPGNPVERPPGSGNPGWSGGPAPWTPPAWQNPSQQWRPDAGSWNNVKDWEGKGGDARTRQLDAYLAASQMGFDRDRFTQEFNASNQRWGAEHGRGLQNDRFSQDLANRQFGLSERQFNTSTGQWEKQFNQERSQFDQTFGEGRRQFDTSFGEGQRQFNQAFGEGQRQFGINTQQRGLDRESQLTQSRYGAFGRAQAPNSRMARSW